jgi:hypothetical protein
MNFGKIRRIGGGFSELRISLKTRSFAGGIYISLLGLNFPLGHAEKKNKEAAGEFRRPAPPFLLAFQFRQSNQVKFD